MTELKIYLYQAFFKISPSPTLGISFRNFTTILIVSRNPEWDNEFNTNAVPLSSSNRHLLR
ncbi:hypothetical protein JHX96_08075 [Staphylococcus saccharolyticus]|uniref:hypothetical protein n=1 Tax=Staphylococcus saccharolyticus TaxID=33028 RepID=UPI00102D93FA|nr:hypothetical protein [Staphylococcus saccharolyticus]MBL7573683.1 hypothetical protein [Staphylococcus saccharolyticus]MBL7584527.1 hypothetical protein [Staphylococcus saccharolyticus]MBL7639389.1 hypothetical protein [Staphylococcus saccharolyticus]QRJ68707.1 hypothetical protein DMB75_002310 [Staphylococcus saccharolyticus]TAA92389.1 hypothetical protein DMB77_07195 [Staphylococcus saccharolyticus]